MRLNSAWDTKQGEESMLLSHQCLLLQVAYRCSTHPPTQSNLSCPYSPRWSCPRWALNGWWKSVARPRLEGAVLPSVAEPALFLSSDVVMPLKRRTKISSVSLLCVNSLWLGWSWSLRGHKQVGLSAERAEEEDRGKGKEREAATERVGGRDGGSAGPIAKSELA
jgi:hypothetical protein